MAAASAAADALRKAVTARFPIEYNGFLSNHMVHGLFSLGVLGATEPQLHQFYSHYARKFEPEAVPEWPVSATAPELEPEPAPELAAAPSAHPTVEPSGLRWPDGVFGMKGARVEMPRLTQAFEDQLVSAQSLDDLLIESIDHLAEGVGSSLLHSLIHLGYGLHAFETIGKSNRTDDTADSTLGRALLAEGLAYNVYGFTSFGRHDALEKADYPEPQSLADATLLEDTTLAQIMALLDEALSDPAIVKAFSHRVDDAYTSHPKQGPQRTADVLLAEAPVELTALFNRLPVVAGAALKQDDGTLLQLGDALMVTMVRLYTQTARPNDFVVLHGVTGAWSVLQLLPHLESAPRVQRKLLGYFWNAIFLILVARGIPTMAPTVSPYRNFDDPAAPLSSTNPVASWDTLRAVAHQDPTRDEHHFKLVQVLYELSTDPATSGRFKRHDTLFRQACSIGLSHELGFGAVSGLDMRL